MLNEMLKLFVIWALPATFAYVVVFASALHETSEGEEHPWVKSDWFSAFVVILGAVVGLVVAVIWTIGALLPWTDWDWKKGVAGLCAMAVAAVLGGLHGDREAKKREPFEELKTTSSAYLAIGNPTKMQVVMMYWDHLGFSLVMIYCLMFLGLKIGQALSSSYTIWALCVAVGVVITGIIGHYKEDIFFQRIELMPDEHVET